MRISRRFKALKAKVEDRRYELTEALDKVKECANAKYDESIDIAVKLNIDVKKQDQQIRGISNLPHGTGRTKRILVLTKGEKEKEARDAGADHVGFDDYVAKIKGGWFDFDVIIATPDVMSEVGKLGKLLGPKGLMPSPKSGTVTFEVASQVKALKKGKVEFKSDKGGCVHCSIGRASFDRQKLQENLQVFLDDLRAVRPASLKGQFVKTITISSTIGPAIRLDERELMKGAKGA